MLPQAQPEPRSMLCAFSASMLQASVTVMRMELM